MNMTTKNTIFVRYLDEYLLATDERKKVILDHVCDVTLIHRKSAIRKFRKLQFSGKFVLEKRGRKIYYTADVSLALKTIWQAASELCGELIYPIIDEYVQILKRDDMWSPSDETTTKLLAMSQATVKRRVAVFMGSKEPSQGKSATNPSRLKEIIPIFTGPWQDKGPGYGQVDTVVHCGSSLLGDLVFSVNYTDVATLWLSLSAQWNKGQRATRDSLARIQSKVPFVILGMHPDTGSEFINWHLLAWCNEQNIELTRSRPNHKNDNAHVEQKNGHVIRRFLGYTRLDHRQLVPRLNQLYDLLETYLNHFVPSRKCLEKVRVGSKYRRSYDQGRPAYRRVLTSPAIATEVKEQLEKQHGPLNPLLLKRRVDSLIKEIFKLNRTLREPPLSDNTKEEIG